MSETNEAALALVREMAEAECAMFPPWGDEDGPTCLDALARGWLVGPSDGPCWPCKARRVLREVGE